VRACIEQIRTEQKNIELRKGKAKKSDVTGFQCGKNIRGGVIGFKPLPSAQTVMHACLYRVKKTII